MIELKKEMEMDSRPDYENYLSFLMQGNRQGCFGIVDTLIEEEDLLGIYEEYFKSRRH